MKRISGKFEQTRGIRIYGIDASGDPVEVLVDSDGKVQITGTVTAVITNLDVALSTRASETTLSALNTKVPSDPAKESGKLTTMDSTLTAIKDADGIKKITDDVTISQTTRTNLKTQPEREDLISLRGTSTPNAAGVQIIAPDGAKKIKVYDTGYECAVDGLHYFYFGTTTAATTRAFLTRKTKGAIVKTFVQPRVSDAGDGLYVYAAVTETQMDWDIGYVQE